MSDMFKHLDLHATSDTSYPTRPTSEGTASLLETTDENTDDTIASDDGPFIPPKDAKIKLLAGIDLQALFTDSSRAPFLHNVDLDNTSPNLLWHIQPVSIKGRYALVHAESQRAIGYDSMVPWQSPRTDMRGDPLTEPTKHWQLVGGTGTRKTQVCLYHPLSMHCLTFFKGGRFPCVMRQKDDPPTANQWFTLIPEDADLISIVYDFVKAAQSGNNVMYLDSLVHRNTGQTPLPFKGKLKYTRKATRKFSLKSGWKAGVKASASIGLPYLGKTKVELSAEYHREVTFEQVSEDSQDFETEVGAYTLEAGWQCITRAVVTQKTLNVPFVATFRARRSGVDIPTTGLFVGLVMTETQIDSAMTKIPPNELK